MNFEVEPKNPRLSIHNKYKRRLNRLALAVDAYSGRIQLDDPIQASCIFQFKPATESG